MFGHGFVGLVTLVRQGNDVTHALVFKFVNGLLGRGDFVVELGGAQGARRIDGFASHRDRHDTDFDPINLLDGPGLQVSRASRERQRGACCGHHIARKCGCFASAFAQLVQKTLEHCVTIVKLMVAGCEGIKTDGVHHLGIHSTLEKGVVKRAGQCIASVKFEQVFGTCDRLEHRCLAGKTTQLHLCGNTVKRQFSGCKGIQLGMVVVDVGNVEFDRLESGCIVAATARGQCQTRQGQCACAQQGV